MNSSINHRCRGLSFLMKIFLPIVVLVFFTDFLFAQNPNSDTTTTGQILTVRITSPLDGTISPGPPSCTFDVSGFVTLSDAPENAINILYVIDVSGSTTDPAFHPPIDVNGDGKIDAGDDVNGDNIEGDILDAEIAGILALNESIGNLPQLDIGVIAFASRPASADVDPNTGFQNFTAPPRVDLDENGLSDIEEVLRSLDSELIAGGSIELFQPISRDSLGNSTNFEAALRVVLSVLGSQSEDEKNIVFFLSDGNNRIGGELADEIAEAASRGIVINAIGITTESSAEELSAIAEGTGGTFLQVEDPAELKQVLPAIPIVGLNDVVMVNGHPVTLDAAGTFATTLSVVGGLSDIAATATAEDQTSVTATVSVICSEELSCLVDITAPKEGEIICTDSVKVMGLLNIPGGLPPFTITCDVNGVNAEIKENMFSVILPCSPENETLVATCTVVDSLGNQTICRDTVKVECTEPPVCEITITSPADSAFFCADSVEVKGDTNLSGGAPPFTTSITVNSLAATVSGNTFHTAVPLSAGANLLVAVFTVEDSCGRITVCRDSVVVFTSTPPVCKVEITLPADSTFSCADSADVAGVTTISGGVPPFAIECEINGIPALVVGNAFQAKVPLAAGENVLVAVCTVTDSCGQVTVCKDSVTVFTAGAPVCAVEITSPSADSSVFCTDSLTVVGRTTLSGGAPPLTVECEVNGVAASVSGNTFAVTVPLDEGDNFLVATCTVTDSCGNVSVCTDTVQVFANSPLICDIEIISPKAEAVVCTDTVRVTATTNFDSLSSLVVTCDINGVEAELVDGVFVATVVLSSGRNAVVANCRIQDSTGAIKVISDSITVDFDNLPPRCTFVHDGNSVVGTFFDDHSGLAEVVPKRLRNATLTVDPFTPGAKEVKFRIDAIDPNQSLGFSIDLFDVCGNKFNCDPVFVSLSTDRAQRQFGFTFPEIERYFQLTNFGLTEIRVDLNGHKFSLFTDPSRVATEINAFLMPREGRITIDLVEYLRQGENEMLIVYEGPANTHADLFLLDVVDELDFELKLEQLPVAFRLAQNYPNPFNPTTKIRYDVPNKMSDGVSVQLRIYNLLGELVRVLVDEQKFPGQYVVEWDARDRSGLQVSSGIYVYQIVAGDFSATKRMLLLK